MNNFDVIPRANIPQETINIDWYTRQYVPTILDQMGNTPGFPNQMFYREMPRYWKEHVNPEYVDIRVEGANLIKQIDTQLVYIGDNHQSMAPDVPFDPVYQSQLQEFLKVSNYFSEDNHKYYPEPHTRNYNY